jgi:hypothetical protein
MLKVAYTEAGLHIEQLTQSVEEWVALCTVLSLRVGQPFAIERGTASLLLAARLDGLHVLKTAIQQQEMGILSMSICDTDYVEISLDGIWTSSDLNEPNGIFLTILNPTTEIALLHLWNLSQTYLSSLQQ